MSHKMSDDVFDINNKLNNPKTYIHIMTKIDINKINEAISFAVKRTSLRNINTPWTQTEIQFMKDNYEKIELKSISKIIQRHTINSIKKKATELKLTKKHYARYINEKFFDTCNDKSAYVLGFIYADGCVVKRSKNSHSLQILIKEYEHLKNISDIMKSTYKITKIKLKSKIYYATSISNNIMTNKLIELGVVPRKSNIIKFPDFIPETNMPDFIRGHFDGDGCISIKKQKNCLSPMISICSGSEQFALDLNDYLWKYVKTTTNIQKHNNAFYIYFGNKENTTKFFKYMYYKKDLLFLKRKYDKFMSYLSYYRLCD